MRRDKHSTGFLRFSVGCLLSAVTAICILLGSCIALIKYAQGKYEIATIDCGLGREIVFTSDRSWEIAPPIYYFVRVNDTVVVPITYIDASPLEDPTRLNFTRFVAKGGDLVGVTYADDPSVYLVVHDFTDNASWPCGDHVPWSLDATGEENRDRGRQSRQALERILDSARSNGSAGR
jgi:hypothetical protein